MKYLIIILLFVFSLVYAGYYLYNYDKNVKDISQTPQLLTQEFWRNVTPEQLKEELKTIENVNIVESGKKINMLHLLFQYGEYPEMVDTLISAGVNYNLKSDHKDYSENENYQLTVLCSAINRRIREIQGKIMETQAGQGIEFTKEILKYDVNVKDFCIVGSVRVTPLIMALWSKMPFEIINSLLEKGADVNDKIRGFTTLMVASSYDDEIKLLMNFIDPKIIQLLLDYGADITVKNEESKTAYDYMKENKEFIKTGLFKEISIQFQN